MRLDQRFVIRKDGSRWTVIYRSVLGVVWIGARPTWAQACDLVASCRVSPLATAPVTRGS
jgi:hypothetical protein